MQVQQWGLLSQRLRATKNTDRCIKQSNQHHASTDLEQASFIYHSSWVLYAFHQLVTTDLGGRPRVSGNVEDKATGDKADKCHQVEGKAPAIHSKGHCGANVGGKEATNHATLSTTDEHLFHTYW